MSYARGMGWRRRSLPTIDISPSDSDVEIVSDASRAPVLHNWVPSAGPPKGDGPSMAAFPLTRATAERKFWSGSRDAHAELDIDVDVPAGVPRRGLGRSIFSKLLFLLIGAVVLTLIACEISIAFKLPWLDPRPALLHVKQIAA